MRILLLAALALPARAEWFDASQLDALSAQLKEGAAGIRTQAPPEPQRLYNTLFPYYAEICAVTQMRGKGKKPGGTGGHATMFVNGAELDSAAGYPRLKLVAEGADLSGPDSGVGVSVNKVFSNANWVAVPGRSMFFGGELGRGEKLDAARYDAVVAKTLAAGWFEGIAMHPEELKDKPEAMTALEYVIRKSIGTDFALNFARDANCARIPVEREQMAKIIEHMNGYNDRAREKGYKWNLLTNNCSHVLHNALAAAGVWHAKKIRGSRKRDVALDVLSAAKGLLSGRMSDFSFPANNFVRTHEAGNEKPIDDVLTAFRDGDTRRTVREGWSSTDAGALVVKYPMAGAGENELFEQGKDPFIFSIPVVWDKKGKYNDLTREPDAGESDLGSNLARYRQRYADILAEKKPAGRYAFLDGRERRDFPAFHAQYYELAEKRLAQTDELLERYKKLAGQPDGLLK